MRRSLASFSTASSTLAALALLSYSSVASAQDVKIAATPVAAPAVVVVGDNVNDHDTVVGHFAVGYFGISNLPIAPSPTATTGAMTTAATSASIAAPIIGARYWLTPKLGIDAGVGFSDSNNGWGVAIHGGVPLALATSKHLTFELIPETTVAFTGNSTGTGAGSNSQSGFRFDLGARIGGEIQFGFIGIPQLALQGTIGLYLTHDSISETPSGAASVSSSTTTFTTSVNSDPWGIFTDNISALYYF